MSKFVELKTSTGQRRFVNIDSVEEIVDLYNCCRVYFDENDYFEIYKTYDEVVAIIKNRQQAEIKQAKSEAIKEFAERLRREVANTWFGVCCTGETEEYKEGCLRGLVAKQKHCIGAINNLLTEMVGGENANK